VADLTEKGNEVQIAGLAYEKEVEPYFFDFLVKQAQDGRTNREENWVARTE
jgi:hypothetical protein